MLPIALAAGVGAAATRAAGAAAATVGVRCNSDWLRGRPPTVDVDAGTLASFYYKHVRGYELPSRDAVVAPAQDLKMTVGQLDRHVYAYAKGFLESLGVRPGTVVAVWMGNEVENFVVHAACSLLGATTLSLDPAIGFDGLLNIASSENVRVIFMSPRHGAHSRIDQVHAAFEPELDPFVRSAIHGYAPIASKRLRSLKYIVQSGFEQVDGVVRLRDLPVAGNEGEYEEDDIAAVQQRFTVSSSDAVTRYYSGSDGAAAPVKNATFSHRETLATAAAAASALELTTADTVAVTAPLHTHLGFAAGWLAALSAHAKIVSPSSKPFDAGKALAAITAQRATKVVATAEQARALSTELQADAGKPADKQQYAATTLRAGLIHGDTAGIALGSAKLRSFAPAK